MKIKRTKSAHFVGIVVCLASLVALSHSQAQAPPSTIPVPGRLSTQAQTPAYTLTRRRIADTAPTAYVWEAQSASPSSAAGPSPPDEVFSSFASPALRRWVGHLPPGSTITDASGLLDSSAGLAYIIAGTRPLPPPTEAEAEDFAAFCKSKNVVFSFPRGEGIG